MIAQRECALEVVTVTKRFGSVTALKDASLRVRAGEIHGLCGQNGAGKSTLVRIINGSHPAGSYEGELRVAGSIVTFASPADARRRGIAMVPQETSILEELSVAENIVLGRAYESGRRLVRGRDFTRDASAFLERRRIHLDPLRRAGSLTMHERQLVMIARALYLDPVVLILDEPTASLSEDEVENLFGIISQHRADGGTSIFITHRLDEVMALCDCVSIVRDGSVVAQLDRNTMTPPLIAAAMIGRDLTHLFPARPDVAADAAEVLRVESLDVADPRVPGRTILRDVGLSVRAGEILGLAGLVGSGRSELMGVLYGRARPIRGTIRVGGSEVTIGSPGAAIRRGIGYLTEDRKAEGLLGPMSVRENLTLSDLPSVCRGPIVDRGLEREAASRLAATLQVRAPSIETPASRLSGGNQQKVVLGRSLLPKPGLLMLDEPTKGVDIAAKADIYRLIADLAAGGVGVLLVSSELGEVAALSHRVLVLRGGRIVAELANPGLTEQQLLLAATVGAAKDSVPA